VQGNAMAKLSLQIENKWINILECFGFAGATGAPTGGLSTAVSSILTVTGNNFLPGWATCHAWRGSTGLELSLDMRFDAVDDANADVLARVKRALRGRERRMPQAVENVCNGSSAVGRILAPSSILIASRRSSRETPRPR